MSHITNINIFTGPITLTFMHCEINPNDRQRPEGSQHSLTNLSKLIDPAPGRHPELEKNWILNNPRNATEEIRKKVTQLQAHKGTVPYSWKTDVCKNAEKCRMGEKCIFAHSLTTCAAVNLWKRPSYKKFKCPAPESCKYQQKCRMIHPGDLQHVEGPKPNSDYWTIYQPAPSAAPVNVTPQPVIKLPELPPEEIADRQGLDTAIASFQFFDRLPDHSEIADEQAQETALASVNYLDL